MGTDKIRTKDVLKVIGVGAIVLASVAIPTLPIAAGTVIKAWKSVNKKDLGRIIKRLQRQEMISVEEGEDQTIISITDKGKMHLLKYNFDDLRLKTKRRDGKWRLIVFDIPEYKKRNRDVFRKKLLELGFIRLQDSVFASAFPCKNEVDFLCHYLEISDFVTLVKLDTFERGEELLFKDYSWLQTHAIA